MHLWRKMRRVWLSVSAHLKPHKPSGGKGGGRSNASGLLKLQDDVKMCGYRDVQVMWNLLNTSQIKQMGAAATTPTRTKVSHHDHHHHHHQPRKYCRKERDSWMAFSWPKLRATTTAPSSSPFSWFKSL